MIRFVVTTSQGRPKMHMLSTETDRRTGENKPLCGRSRWPSNYQSVHDRPPAGLVPCGQCLQSFRMFIRRQGREPGGLSSHLNTPDTSPLYRSPRTPLMPMREDAQR